jgi:hypothetical protein
MIAYSSAINVVLATPMTKLLVNAQKYHATCLAPLNYLKVVCATIVQKVVQNVNPKIIVPNARHTSNYLH